MIGGLIVMHGKLGEELLNVLTIITGETANIEARFPSAGTMMSRNRRRKSPPA